MKKKSDIVGSFGKGIGYGVMAGSAVELARTIVGAIEDYKANRRRKHPKIDKNTIVLSIPKKQIEDKSEKKSSARDQFDDDKVSSGKNIEINNTSRDTLGRFTPGWINKDAQAWPWVASTALAVPLVGNMDKVKEKIKEIPERLSENTGTILGGVAGLSLGYILARKIAQKVEENRLKREIAAAQQEYIDAITSKHASYDILPVLPVEKVADIMGTGEAPIESSANRSMLSGVGSSIRRAVGAGVTDAVKTLTDRDNSVNTAIREAVQGPVEDLTAKGVEYGTWAASAGVATTILAALSLAYVTKKILDKKYGNPIAKKDIVPRKTRVLFKVSEDNSFEISPATAIAALGFIKAAVSEQTVQLSATNTAVKPLAIKGAQASEPAVKTPAAASTGNVHTQEEAEKAYQDWENKLSGDIEKELEYGDYISNYLSDEGNFRTALNSITGRKGPAATAGYLSQIQLALKDPELMWKLRRFREMQTTNPERFKAIVGNAIMANPTLLKVLNNDYSDFMNNQAETYINNYFSPNGSGFGKALATGWFSGSPLPDLFKKIALWLFKNTGFGRTIGLRNYLSNGFISDPKELSRVMHSAFPTPISPKFSSEKEAGVFNVMEGLANIQTLSDSTNTSLNSKLDELLEDIRAKKRNTNRKYVSIRGDKETEDFIRKNRDKILKIIRDLNSEIED